MARIGIDLGGTKTEILVLNNDGSEYLRKRVNSPQGSYAKTLKMLTDLVISTEQALGLSATVGIGTPGAISQQHGRLKNSNSTWLNDQPLCADLEHALQRPIRILNDANCFALSEATDGAGKEANTVFGVIIGTGTGAGVVINQQILEGANRIAGEWGHNPLPWPDATETLGRKCYCGKQNCIETYLSGPGMQHDHLSQNNESLTPIEIVQRANNGHSTSMQTLQRYEKRLAKSLAHVINLLDPEVIVLGGGLSNIESLYTNVPKLWTDYIFSYEGNTKLVKALHGDSSGVRGAARLWPASTTSED